MRNEHGKIEGDVRLDEDLKLHGMIVGNVTVPDGFELWLHGMVTGDLIVHEGGAAIVHGTVCGNVDGVGPTAIYGVVSGAASGDGVSVDPAAHVGK